jgi:cytoskeletal protein CcmA (bactofilin family)
MFGKSKSVEGWKAQSLQQPALGRSPIALQPMQTTASLSPEMTVVGKIICKGAIKIHGLVEGEVNASNALIANGARIRGDIVAEELTVAGRVKGDIYALRVKLQGTAVVEGDIFHRSLSMDEHARFEGCSRPEDDPPEPRPYIKVESANPQPQPQALVAFADKEQFRGKPNEEEQNQAGGTGIHVLLRASQLLSLASRVISSSALCSNQQDSLTPPTAYALIQVGLDH